VTAALAILVGLLLLNAVFAMAELAVMTSRHSRLQRAEAGGSRAARDALRLARDPTRFLSVVQLGVTLIGILAGAFGEQRLAGFIADKVRQVDWAAPYAQSVGFTSVIAAITVVWLVLGELVPKRIALAYPERVATVIATPLRVLSFLAAWPVRMISLATDGVLALIGLRHRSDDVSEEDVRALMARAASTGVFSPQEHAILQRVFRTGDLLVRDLMVPRGDIVWIDRRSTPEQLRVLIGTSPYSHFPVCDGDVDRIVGIIHIKDVIAHGLLSGGDFALDAIMRQPLFVPEMMPALKLLDQLGRTKSHLAVVVNEFGGTEGVLTLNDISGAIVGDVVRSHDADMPALLKRDDGSLLVDGRLPMIDLMASMGVPAGAIEDLPDVSTAAGLMMALVGRIPREADSVLWRGWRIEVIDMDGTRIDKLLLVRAASDVQDATHG
jgi:putative hemolysin